MPPALGTYTFKVKANNGGTNDQLSDELSITVSPPGKRMVDGATSTPLTIAKRYVGAAGALTTNAQGQSITADANGYVNVSMVKRYNSSTGQWETVANN